KAQWVETGAIEPFALGQQDISDRFHVPQKLYGREKEIRTLLDTLDRAGEGASELLMVAGYSGVGKTVLIEEVHKPLAGRKGYYLSGKFDQYRRDIPYAEIVGAFRGLVQQILGERDEQIQSWRQKILAAVGDNGRVIIETIPEVEAIIGPQPAALEIGALEAEKRFNETFGRFVGVFCQAEHPVLLFLDDLQWADPATLKLIQLLMTDMAVHHLLIIGAYRDNEVSGSHPLMLALDVIQESRPVETIHLKPLHQKHTRDLVADAVRRTDAAVDALAALIYRKTNGSPFFISRLLSAVHDQGMLWFDRTEMRWAWDAERIGAMQASDNVVGLMVAQMQQVPSETQAFLRLASCLGTLFDVQMVARVAERPLAEVIAAFAAAIEEDLITPVDAALRFAHWSAQDGDSVDVDAFRAAQYRFAHDRILEAAYSQLSDQERLETHHRIGMTMVALWSDTALEDHVFDIVNQLNKATSLLVAREDQIRVARLNLNAAQRARTSMAHAAASIFLDAGIALLGEEGWQDDPDTLFALYYNKTECAFLCGQLPQSEAAFETTIARARNATDQLKTYELMMRIHLTSNKFDKGLALAREALPLYGIDLVFDEPEKMAALADQELAAVEARLTGRDLEPLLEAPVHGDESLSYCFAILFRVWTLAFLSGNLPTMNYAGLKMVSLTLDRGNDKYSSFGYIVFGMIEAAGKENYARAYELGMLAMTMNKRFRNVAAIPPMVALAPEAVTAASLADLDALVVATDERDEAGVAAVRAFA
ncbi:MAG: ATP-binding protein, partial [Rhodospirillaceae bacterium]